jgi:hypothetical protein
MRFTRKHAALIGAAVVCAAAGAGVSAIANAGASSGTAARPAFGHARAGRLGAHFGVRRLLLRAVHGQIVVATRMGFRTITFDRGSVQSVNGRQLTLKDGNKRATYQTITLTIPTAARVRDDGQLASLGDVKPGQRALVIQAAARTLVIARTP